MKILFLCGGAREKALEFIVEQGTDVAGVITPLPSSNNDRFMNVIDVARRHNIPVYYSAQQGLYEIVSKINFNIMVSCGFTYKIDKDVIDLAKYAINVHPTLLPKYRGYRSGSYILINGEKKSGVTIHFLTEDFDKGNIIMQEEFDVSPFDTPKSMVRKTSSIEGKLLFHAIKKLEQEDFKGIAQDERNATTFNYIRTPKDSEVNWNEPLIQLYNEIRACDPEKYPAFFYVNGEKVCIRMWREEKNQDENDMI